eukprot:2626312-Pyramimonas_sp.AAC.1
MCIRDSFTVDELAAAPDALLPEGEESGTLRKSKSPSLMAFGFHRHGTVTLLKLAVESPFSDVHEILMFKDVSDKLKLPSVVHGTHQNGTTGFLPPTELSEASLDAFGSNGDKYADKPSGMPCTPFTGTAEGGILEPMPT